MTELIDLAVWLASRVPEPPPVLSARLAEAALGRPRTSRSELPAALMDCAEDLLRGLGGNRDAAVDLLAADALVTYAMEAAAEDGESIEEVATQAMKRIAAIDRSAAQ